MQSPALICSGERPESIPAAWQAYPSRTIDASVISIKASPLRSPKVYSIIGSVVLVSVLVCSADVYIGAVVVTGMVVVSVITLAISVEREVYVVVADVVSAGVVSDDSVS